MASDLSQHSTQVELRIETVKLVGADQGLHGGGAFRAGVRSRKQEVLPSKSDSSERSFQRHCFRSRAVRRRCRKSQPAISRSHIQSQPQSRSSRTASEAHSPFICADHRAMAWVTPGEDSASRQQGCRGSSLQSHREHRSCPALRWLSVEHAQDGAPGTCAGHMPSGVPH